MQVGPAPAWVREGNSSEQRADFLVSWAVANFKLSPFVLSKVLGLSPPEKSSGTDLTELFWGGFIKLNAA